MPAASPTPNCCPANEPTACSPSHHIEVFADVILAAIEAQKDLSLVELAELLRTGHGASFAASTVWRFLDRHAMTFKKNSTRQRAGTARRRRAAASLVRRPA
jgi:hypothetical protein